MLISQKIEKLMCRSGDAISSIGQFVLEQKGQIGRYSVREIAEQTFTSPATLVRFAKKIGYSGWKDFVMDYLTETQYFESSAAAVNVNLPFAAEDPMYTVAQKVAQVRREANLETIRLLQESDIRKAVHILKGADRIMMCGGSVNRPLATLFQYKMLRIGKIVENIGSYDQEYMSYALTEKDCVIMVSYSGNSYKRIPTSLLPALSECGVPIIGITSMGDNLIRKYATCTFTIPSRENLHHKIASYATEESISVLLDVLYSCYFAIDYDKNLQRKFSTGERVEKGRMLVGRQKE